MNVNLTRATALSACYCIVLRCFNSNTLFVFLFSMLLLGANGISAQCLNFAPNGPFNSDDASVTLITIPPVSNPNITGESFSGPGITSISLGTFNPGTAGAGVSTINLAAFDAMIGCPPNPNLIANILVCDLEVSCKDATLLLDSNCSGTVTPAMIDNGSTDDECGIMSMSVSPNNFDFDDIGIQVVTLTVTNQNGISRTCTSNVTVTVPCPAPQGFAHTIDGISSPSSMPDTVCTNAGDLPLAVTITNAAEENICVVDGVYSSNTPNTVSDGLNNTGTFNPALAELGLNVINFTYTCPISNEIVNSSINVIVVMTPTAELIPDTTLVCIPDTGAVFLSDFYEETSTKTGIWRFVSGPAGVPVTIAGSTYYYNTAGCYVFEFEAADPYGCHPTPPKDVVSVHLQTLPKFDFTLSSQGGCLATGEIIVTATAFPPLPSNEIESGTVAVGDGADMPWTSAAVGTMEPPNSGETEDYTFCIIRTNIGSVSCGSNGMCADTVCQIISVYNDGLNCESMCEENPVDVCDIDVEPRLQLACSFFNITVPFDLVGANITPQSKLINCDDEEVFINYNFEAGGVNPESIGNGGGGATIGSLPGISIVCDVFNFCICIDIGFIDVSFRPFSSLYNALGCNKTIAQFILELLGKLLGGDGGGVMVVADTDGDGAFDYEVEDGSNLSGTNVSVPVNIEGPGELTIRMVTGWPNKPADVCGTATVPGQDLLTLLPIGAIPVVGPTVVALLEAASCNVDLSWSNEKTVVYKVVNANNPVFVNCPQGGISYTFSEDFTCDTEANWSIPVAIDGCSGEILPYVDGLVLPEGGGVRKIQGQDPGSEFEIGIDTVLYEAVSCNGLTDTCQILIIIDAGDPTLIVPNDFVVCTDIDKCETTVLGLEPLRGIGCNTVITYYTTGATITASMGVPNIGYASGLVYEIGVTTINYTMTWENALGEELTQMESFTVTVEDCQLPVAECNSVTAQLDNEGNVTITAMNVDALSSDNCTAAANLDIQISKSGGIFTPSVDFNCDELGINFITLRVIDEAGNASFCLAQVVIVDFFDDYTMTMDLPELCLEANNPEQFDFTNYLNITQPNGTIIGAEDVAGVIGGDVVGLFGITSFIPSANSTGVAIGTSAADPADIGYIDAFTGVYTPGTGSGFVTISYIMTIGGEASESNNALDGCYKVVHETFELKQPLTMDSPMCECLGVNSRQVDLGIVSGGLEPYRLEYTGGTLDFNEDNTPDDIDGIFTFDVANGFNIDDGLQDLGLMWLNYTSPIWSITVVDARGCEIARSGSCDIIDETVGPEIDCRGTNDFDTEVFICERQYSWLHAIPTDNCAVTQYSYTITNPDGTIEGPFTLNALIDDANTGIPLEELLNAEYEFESGSSTITYYAEDAVGNLATCNFVVVVEDNDPPYFINCPYPDVVIATETDQCDVFVNFALPLAEDNCVMPVVTQIDDTGLVVGDRFPIGTTILTYQAVDGVGNKAICNVKVIVNHFDHVPTITCPADVVQINDDWLCGAVVNNINALADELCSDELVKSYQIVQDGEVIHTGIDDASGTYFEVGESQVTYRVQNQPLLLISEITQDGDALIGGMNPPPIVNEFQCFSDTLFTLGNGDMGEGLVYYAEDDLIYHFSGATAGNQFFEEIYFPGKCVQPNHVIADTYGPDPVGQVTGMVWDPVVAKFIAMDMAGNIFTVSTTGDYLQISTFDQAFPISGFASAGTSYYGVSGTDLYEFIPGTGTTVSTTAMTSDGDAIVSAIDITTDLNSGDTYIIYTTATSATVYIGTLDLTTGAITETGDTNIDFAGITVDNVGQVYGVSSKASGSDLYTIKCAIPGDDYIELTNFGPSVYDISCLLVERTLPSGVVESYTVPAGVVLAPGDVMVLHYGPGVDNQNGPSYFLNYCEGTDQPAGAAISYNVSYGNNMIDAMTMFTDAEGGIIREDIFDTDTPADFILAEDCLSITLGEYNSIYPMPIDNGTTASLQSEPKSIAECSFMVSVSDAEPPKCMEIDNMNTYAGPAITAVEGECNLSIISVPEGDECILTEINVSLVGNIVGAESVTISLISPQNDTLELYDKLCAGDAAVDLTFDDESENPASNICGLWSGDFRPQTEMLMKFYTSKLAGDWTIFINVEAGSGASFDMTSWSLESTCMMDWAMEDVVLENDPTNCDSVYTWIHPYYVDNCTFGSIRVDYLSDDGIDLPTGGPLLDNFRKGGYEVTETFAVGVTTVQYTLVDIAGNQSQCSFTVTVNDTELPVITYCPNDIFVALEGGECEEIVFYDVEAMDNCGILSIVGVPASGTYFPIGTTPIVVTVTDIHGNISLCEFDVIVIEYEPESNQLNCNNAINLSLDQNCEAVISADQFLEGSEYGCYDDYCITVTTETGIPHDNYFSAVDINQTFIVTVVDCNTDSTNSCWGTITIEEKFTPEIQCPADITIACNEDPEERDEFNVLLTGEAVLLNCEPGAEIIYEDNATDFGQCATPRMEITRTWIVTDADGNQDFCNQIITIDAIDLNDIVFPEDVDLDMSLECFDVNLDPSLTSPDSTGHPTINEYLVSASGSLCMVSLNMSDEIFDICPGSYEILRTWKIRNMCLPISATNPVEHTQIIKVLDTTAPKMVDCPDDMLLSVDPWGCQGSGFLPIPQNIYDQCSGVQFSAAIYGGGLLEISGTPEAGDLQVFASNLRKGLHTVVYRTKDDCGNTRECEFDINVVDITPPTAIALQDIVISITSGNTQEEGFAKLFVESLDNGSFDGCGPVKLEIRRDSDLCDVSGNTTYNSDGHSQDGSPNPNSPSYDPDGGSYVKFCCEDLTNTDLDVNEDGINDIGYVKVWLRVWDDGSDDGIFGNDGDQFNEAWAYVKVEDKLAPTITCPADITITCADDVTDLNVTGEAVAFGSCGTAPVEYNDIIVNLSTCNEGFVRRRWNVVGRTDVFCDQTITLEGIDEPASVSFAQVGDTEINGCPDQITLGEPTWIGGACDVIGYTLETDTFFFEDGACYKLVNKYSVINWCDYDPNNPFWEETADFTDGLATHTQIVKVTDDTQPVIEDCEDKMFAINDHDDSDGDGIVCEGKIILINSATDPGSANCPTGWLKWQVFVDLWGDGTDDLEFSSYLPPFDSQFNDTNSNGIPDVYVAPTSNGETVAIQLPDIEGSMSNHKVRWIVSDGCQNNASCESEFMVVDKKAPTPYCIDISSAVMENDGTVSIWAIDFNLGSYDNCSSEEDLRYTFTETTPENDPLYDEDSRSSSRVFDCDDVENSPVEVKMYVWDEKGNSDFCLVNFSVIDNNGTCGEGSKVAGKIATEEGKDVSGVEVSLVASLPEYPRVSLTDEDGIYSFLGVSNNADFEILSGLESDYTNGVSTLDLVMIQRHILGLELLDSPYKVFAADVNGDEKLKASDLLILRKLILGVINEIPTNSSWRFVDKSQVFEDIYSPWPVQEKINIEPLLEDILDNDFVAVKIGDVNGNAVPNFINTEALETRNLKSVGIAINDAFVSKGEEVEVVFMADENFDLHGYQFSMELNGLSFVDITSQAIKVNENNLGLINRELVTMSYNDSEKVNLTPGVEMFSMKFLADRSANISEMIKLSSRLTVNEAYIGDDFELRVVDLRFNESEDIQWTNTLYQNEPNPFRKKTSIGFDLVESADVRLSILSATGTIIRTIDIEGEKGYNTYQLNANQVGVNGLYYYTLECGDFSATKKMILVR